MTGHPLLEHSEDLEEFTTIDFSDKFNFPKNKTVTIGGMITRITHKYDRRNRPMAFFEMDCIGGHVDVISFSDCYERYGPLIEDEKVVFVRGKPSDNSSSSDLKLIADMIVPVEQARHRLSGRLIIRFNSIEIASPDIDELFELVRQYPGDCRLVFHFPNKNSSNRPIRVLSHNIRVSTDKGFIRRLREQYGKDNIRVE